MRELSSHKQIDVYIPQLTGLKVVALFGIFYWHSMPSAGLPDLGARLVELFFVVSGFLVGFRNHGTLDSSISGCWNYLLPKIKAFYPVYLIGLALGVFQHILWGGWNVGAETIFPIVWALGLLQAWIPSIAMVYNGASWFISAWTFCMLCAPVLQWMITKMCNRLGEEKGIVAFSAVTLSVRVFIEECQRLVPGVYPYSLHVTPAIRLLEFALAYAVGVMYRERYSGEKSSFTVMSALEIIVTALFLVFILCFDSIWPRWEFVLMGILVIPLLAGGGWRYQLAFFTEATGVMRKTRDGVLLAP